MFAHNPGDGMRQYFLSPLMFYQLGVPEAGWEFFVVICYDSQLLCFTFTEAYEQIVSTELLFYYFVILTLIEGFRGQCYGSTLECFHKR